MLTGIRGKVTKVTQGNDTIVYQVEVDSQTVSDYNNMQMFGITSKAPVGSNCIVLSDGRIGFTVATEGVEYEIELEEGECAIHNSKDNKVVFKRDGSIEVKSNKISLNGSSREFVTHAELDKALQTFVDALNSHKHAMPAAYTPLPSQPPTIPPTLDPITELSLDISASKTEKLFTS